MQNGGLGKRGGLGVETREMRNKEKQKIEQEFAQRDFYKYSGC